MRRALGTVATGLALAALAGCGLFGAARPDPKPLEPIARPMAVQAVWSQQIGGVRFPLVVAVDGRTLVVANDSGEILALDAGDGKVAWRASVGTPLSAGVGSDGRRVAVVTRDNDLVVLVDGRIAWKKPVGARVATPPLVAGGRVFLLAVDRSVHAFDGEDGARLWRVQRPGDPLTLSQAGVIGAFGDTLIAGQGPRLAGFDPANGAVRFEAAIGTPRGANEVERLADLLGPAVRTGDLYCARSFGNGVGCVDAARGRIFWNRPNAGRTPIAGDAELIVGSDGSDRLSAWKTPSGDVAWTSEALLNHVLSAPGLVGGSVVFADARGTLHWMARADGVAQARIPTDGSPLAARPVTVDGVLVVVTRRGGVYAFRPSA